VKIAILETGAPPGRLRGEFGDYPAMLRDILSGAGEFTTFDVQNGAFPDPAAFDAQLVTGSPAGVYDDLPWIAPLLDYLRAAKRTKTRLVGVCFGHQAMAQAFGGQVIKSPKGYGLGRHAYRVENRAPWMAAGGESVSVAVSHQDQVVALPPGATVLAGSDFTPFGALDYGEGAISFQQHPEFDTPFAKALVEIRRGRPLTDEQVESALASFSAAPDDRAVLAGWIRAFLKA
jgi:GMP synthase-like glutamine amidotransferase